MKTLILTLLLVFSAQVANALTYCYWTGTAESNCRTINNPHTDYYTLKLPSGTITFTQASANALGYYEYVVVTPEGDTKDTSEYTFADNTITISEFYCQQQEFDYEKLNVKY